MSNRSFEQDPRPLGGVCGRSRRERGALVFSLWDGIFANVMLALTETFGIAAAVFLKAPAIAIALLGSLPLLLSSFGQLLFSHFVNPASGRKKYVVRGTTMQATFLVLVALSGYFPEPVRVWSFVILFALYGFAGNVVSGFWIAWMGDLVPEQVRGRHFAWRNRIFSITQLLCALVAGLISRRYNTTTAEWLLFAMVFFAAGAARFISTVMMFKQYEPPVSRPQNGFRKLSIFCQSKPFLFYCASAALLQGAASFSGPFFNVWYIRDLHFNYFTLAVGTAATILGTIVALPFWGKLADEFSNRTVIIITVLMIVVVPLPYIASNQAWQIWVLNFYTGVCWCGYNLSNFNYLLIAAGKESTGQKISFAVAVTGILNFVFSIAGGYCATRLPVIFHYQLHSLFLLSSIMRLIIFLTMIVRYPRYEKPRSSIRELLRRVTG